ncbi:MAG: efflux RND transporter periplasmic adaptor subunit [Rhodobacteraceae bacterium]|nr:efflux RND transporter periplasmic adaptor subunit [Paracoccaceae bacterium]
MKNLIAGILGTTLAALVSPLAFAQDAEPLVRPAKVIEVVAKPVALQVQYPAIVYPAQEAELSFRVSGRLIELPVRAADRIAKGDVIAELDKRDFENNLEQLESQRDQANEQIKALRAGARPEDILALEANVNAMQAQLDQASAQVTRTKTLFDKDIVAQAELDNDVAAARIAQANLRTAEEQLAIGNAGGREEDIAAAEAALRGLQAQVDQASNQLGYATLVAPFDGVIAQRHLDNFTNIQAGTNVVLLQQLSTIDMVFDIPGADVLRWTEADPDNLNIDVELSGTGIKLTATELVEFSTQADPGTQTYRARVSVKVPEGTQVLPGMAGRVRVSSQQSGEHKPDIPLTALATDPQGKTFVWIVDDKGAVSANPVTPGPVFGGTVSITDGLAPGVIIVTAGVSRLREGDVIRPIKSVGE